MANLVVSIEGAGVATLRRTKPVLVARRVFRRQVKDLQLKLQQLVRRDEKEAAKGAANDYNAYLFTGTTNSRVDRAVKTLLEHCGGVLKERV